jgi:GIY-YIG catalytic domain
MQLRSLTAEIGVYALCDLDRVPIYIGKSTDGIRARVRRHLTSARSDVIANRQLDVWEIAYVLAWPTPGADKNTIKTLEEYLISHYHSESPLVNGKIPSQSQMDVMIPAVEEVVVLPVDEISKRKDPLLRLPRQIEHFSSLFSHALEVKDNADVRRALETHFSRLQNYYKGFMETRIESMEAGSDT